ncbi:hypothetical protein FRB90_000062 [Tulasnella sp. 427]|nr:hypothetical protein FRB90_000062 [Tulasnella sp. 427]
MPPSARPPTQNIAAQAASSSSQNPIKSERIELLPPESDFRTSLILPDLSRRFSLLRQADGRPVDIQDVREKFAAQRAGGSPNVITEEEEEYVIHYLSNAGHIPGGPVDDRGTDDSQQRSPISTTPTWTIGTPDSTRNATPNSAFEPTFFSSKGPPSTKSRTSHTSNSSRRYSNNLFGSGRLKDQQYLRGGSRSVSNRSLKSVDKKEGSDNPKLQTSDNSQVNGSAMKGWQEDVEDHNVTQNGVAEGIEEDDQLPTDGDGGIPVGQAITSGYDGAYDPPSDLDLDGSEGGSRPVTPVQNGSTNMHHDLPPVLPLSPRSPKSPTASARALNSSFVSPSASPYSPGRKKGPVPLLFSAAQVHRASLALEEVIRNFEQDSNAEEEILTPRTPNGNFQANGYTRTVHPWSRQQSAVSPSLWSHQSKSSTEKEGDASPTPMKSPRTQMAYTQDLRRDASPAFREDTQPLSSRSQHSPLSALARSASARHVGESPPGVARGRLPGYVPGMHRPITPKDVDSEEATTPRALSPSSSSFGQPASPRSGGSSSRTNSEYSQIPHRRFGSLATSTFGPYSPLSPSSPRSATQGTATPIQRPPLVSAWSSTTASPTSPTTSSPLNGDISSAALRMAAMAEESTSGRKGGFSRVGERGLLPPASQRIDRDTKMSTSSSSILPPSTSSSSLTSLYQSDSGTTMLTSPDFGNSFQVAGSSSPGFGSELPSNYSHKPLSPVVSALRTGNNGTIMASPPSTLLSSGDSRPDTPLSQMYTGLTSTVPPIITPNGVDRSAPTGHPLKSALQRGLSERRAMSPGLSHASTTAGPTSMTRQESSSSTGASSGDYSTRGVVSGARSPPLLSNKGQKSQYAYQHARSRSRSSVDIEEEDQALAWNPSSGMKGGIRAAPPKPILVQSSSSSSALAFSDANSLRGAGSATTIASKLVWQRPLFSSSRSSLVSAGSSFHSSEGDALTLDFERVVASKQEAADSPVEESTESDHEDLLNCWGGITRKDLTAIHEKLVDAAFARKRTRSPSTTPARSRSPSVSSFQPFATRSPSRGHQRQGSQYSARSITKDLEKSQVAVVPPSPTWSARKDKANKANALLQSVVDSLPPQAQPASFIPSPTNFGPNTPLEAIYPDTSTAGNQQQDSDNPPPSATSRRSPVPSFNDPESRKKALTEALFGESPSPGTGTPQEEPHPYTTGDLTLDDLEPIRKPSKPVPTPPTEELIAEVSRRNAAATEALKSPGVTRSESGLKRQGTKRLDAKLISGPQPVSSATSLDALPAAATASSSSLINSISQPPQVAQEKLSSKLSLRIKKLRDKLKTRPSIPNGDEVTPYTLETRSISPSSSTGGTAVGHSAVLVTKTVDTSPRKSPTPMPQSAEMQSFRFPSPSPSPASPIPPSHSGTSLKRLMSRLRSNSKHDLVEHASTMSVTGDTMGTPTQQSSQLASSVDHSGASQRPGSPESIRKKPPSVRTDTNPGPNIVDLTSPRLDHEERQFNLGTPTPPSEHTPEETAVKQLFDAASNLGLDKAALNDLLARSASTTSRSTGWTARPGSTATTATSSTVTSPASQRESGAAKSFFGLRREPSTRAPVLSSVSERSIQGLQSDERQTILRRTLIFPSEAENALARRPSQATKASKKKNRFSTQSVQSIRSLQERSPTPPPNRSSRRFSKDPSPPVPALPPGIALMGPDNASTDPLRASHKSQNSVGSAYGSLFEMYGENEGRSSFQAEMSGPPSPGFPMAGPGQAIEVVEMSNGEVVWNIVDAMRGDLGIEDDIASFYQNRLSTTSEYSSPRLSEDSTRDNMQVFFKEHKRGGSKGSATSATSRRLLFPPSGNRPETKVFFSSSDHIGRLIEAMSRGADAGSFNFLPSRQDSPVLSASASTQTFKSSFKSHSPALSMTDSTVPVEERLEHLLKVTSRQI